MVGECCLKHDEENYDVSEFLKNHPGGSNYIRAYNGTKTRQKMLDTFHSKAAMYLLRDYGASGRNKNVIEGQADLEHLVDWNKPILSQIGNLGECYHEWISLPVDRQVRLFHNPFLEILTITPWYVVPLFWTPIIIYFFYIGTLQVLSTQITPKFSVASDITLVAFVFSLGVVLWTFLEYALHRWLFHIKPSGKSQFLIYLHFTIHGIHHKVPFDSRRLVFPPFAAAIITYIFYKLLSYVIPADLLDLVAAGTLTGYVVYDMIHFYLHYGSPKENSYLYLMKRHHNQHHFSHSESAYGISSNYWDKIFGTAITLRKLAFGIKW